MASGYNLLELQSIIEQLIESIAFIHDRGIIHIDLKLDNILLKNSNSFFPMTLDSLEENFR